MVSQIHYPRSKRPGFYEVQIDPILQGGEEGRATSKDDGIDEEPIFVNKAEPRQGRGEGGAADSLSLIHI